MQRAQMLNTPATKLALKGLAEGSDVDRLWGRPGANRGLLNDFGTSPRKPIATRSTLHSMGDKSLLDTDVTRERRPC